MTKDRISWPVMTLTSGPVDAYPAVLRGLSRTIAYDYDPAFQLFYEAVVEKTRRAMRDSEDARHPAWRAGTGPRGGRGVADRS